MGHKENGESIFRYIYTDIQKELTVKLRQSIEVYQSVELTEESRMALGQWLEQWLKNIAPNIRPSTLRRYEGTVRNHIVPFMGDKPITQITGKDIKSYMIRWLVRETEPQESACQQYCPWDSLHAP
ncbi:N-terminal phage integrase SAM-like domain-containing protein [Flavonifractor plautii]|nr:N-terminal phage integrase SAM-like domain-containing protein [Flavonifractor plautii]